MQGGLEDPRPSTFVAALGLAAILVTGLFGAMFWITHDAGPDRETIAEAAAVVRAGYQDGDLVFLVPFYATRAREFLGDLEGVLAVRDPLDEDLAVHPRVWVFGLFGAADPLADWLLSAGNVRVDRSVVSGEIVVDLYKTGSAEQVIFDFVEALPRARVWHEKSGQQIECDAWHANNGQGGPHGRWACPYDKDWFYVAPEWHRMGEHLRFCLWAHPPNEGRLMIRYAEVPGFGVLAGRGGHTLNATRYARERVDLEVTVGSGPAQVYSFGLEDTYEPFRLRMTSLSTTTVTFAISSPDAGANHFCFVADVRQRPGVYR